MPVAPTAGSAAPSPHKGVNPRAHNPAALARRAASALAELYEFDEAEVSMQTSKSGRVRKVTSFTGAKRKMGGDMVSHGSAPAALAGGYPLSPASRMVSDSGATSADEDGDDDEVTKAAKKAAGKGKRKRWRATEKETH